MSYKKGEWYFTTEEITKARQNKIGLATLKARVKYLGWTVERAVSEPVNKCGRFSKVFTKEDYVKAKEKGISMQLLNVRIRRGWSKNKALITPPIRKGKY